MKRLLMILGLFVPFAFGQGGGQFSGGGGSGGASFPLTSTCANPATIGALRLCKTDLIAFRNNANTANLQLGIDANDNWLFGTAQPFYLTWDFSAVASNYTWAAPANVAAGLFRDDASGNWSNSELSGDATTSGSNAVTVVAVNGVGIQRVTMTADWTCGTGGTVSSCAAATIVGTSGTPLTITLPSVAGKSYHWQCDGVVGQATAATANNWNFVTATNAPTNIEATYAMATAATASAYGATTGASSTTTTNIGGTWTLGGTATKMPFHIQGSIEGASASGTAVSLQLVAPTVADLVTIYRGATCSTAPF